MENSIKDEQVKVGFFAIVGRPNVGKSSLLNLLVGQKVSIVSYKPQTTRNRITGIYSDQACQLILFDTPGFINMDNKLGSFMSNEIKVATNGIDGLIYVVDATKTFDDQQILSIKNYSKFAPIIVVVNKMDVASFDFGYPTIQAINNLGIAKAIIPMSVLKGQNEQLLKDACIELSSMSERHYDVCAITDRTVRFMAGEIIREKILLFYEQEIPHGVGVIINDFDDKPNLAVIAADIICSKRTHKPIIIGKNGSGIKKIGIAARKDIEQLIEKKVHLELFVKIRDDWKNNNNYINDIGYTDKK
jgi:GTP-binding protein Era